MWLSDRTQTLGKEKANLTLHLPLRLLVVTVRTRDVEPPSSDALESLDRDIILTDLLGVI